ncbi:MAG TPA: hypothetical protein VHR15_05575 [Ktedonobacterales bacterium]|jgi:hypothetical protein|nr:hypothetical protein [Ktedonobacterales bacterium]
MNTHDIVVIGASAGGVEALTVLAAGRRRDPAWTYPHCATGLPSAACAGAGKQTMLYAKRCGAQSHDDEHSARDIEMR